MAAASPGAADGALVGVDVGGTFTDAVVVSAGRLVTAKVPTTPQDQSEAVVAAVLEALGRAGLEPSDVARFGHGMTVGTNALLEGTGARTSLVATEGFGDLLELRRQTRAHLYRLDAHHPPPLVPHERAHEVRERTGPGRRARAARRGVARARGPGGARRRVRGRRGGAALLVRAPRATSGGWPRRCARRCPDVHVSASCEVLPEIREYERLSTTAVDAYLTPVLRAYLDRLARPGRRGGAPGPGDHAVQRRRAADRGLPRPRGLDGPQRAGRRRGRRGARGRARGPAAGPDLRHGRDVVRRRARARRRPGPRRGDGDRGAPAAPADARRGHGLRRRGQRGVGRLGRRAARGPALRRGASRAGGLRSRRGPADRHGRRRRPRADPRGPPPRRPPARRRARRGPRWPASPRSSAWRWRRAPRASSPWRSRRWCARLRLVSVERGEDPREATLVAFGGAGPLHACPVADELGVRRVVAPPAAGVLAALGLVVAGERRDFVQTVLAPVDGGSTPGRPAGAAHPPGRGGAARRGRGTPRSTAATSARATR